MPKKSSETCFAILCETHRSADDNSVNFHLQPSHSRAVLVQETVSECGIEFHRSYVKYGDYEYQLHYIRPGLDGAAVTLGLKESYSGWILELYTDTPVANSKETPATIRENARRTLARKC